MFLPSECVACGRPAAVVCEGCRAGLTPAPELGPPAELDRFWALLAYEGSARDLVAAFKYRRRRDLAVRLAPGLCALVDEPFDVVTWLPTTSSRRRDRGYDQARLLARAVSRRLTSASARPLLRRRPGPPQTGRPAADRAAGPSLVARRVPTGARVLVVDDVVTTGASMVAAVAVLRGAGAGAVAGLALARTPLKTAARHAETS